MSEINFNNYTTDKRSGSMYISTKVIGGEHVIVVAMTYSDPNKGQYHTGIFPARMYNTLLGEFSKLEKGGNISDKYLENLFEMQITE